MSAPFKYRITARTDVGLVRDHNEDNFIVCPDLAAGEWRFDGARDYDPGEQGAVWVVADGMGGTNAGEVASNIAVEHVKKTFNDLRASGLPPMGASGDLLARTLMGTNQAIADHARRDPSAQGMGTTAVVAWLRGNVLSVSWVGDSRAYLFRNGRLRRISRDHSLVQQLVDNGTITDEQAFHHPQSNIILQSLGDGSSDIAPGRAEVVLTKGDVVMLCTDGLNGMVMDVEMEVILQKDAGLDATAEELITAAKAAGGHDNITVVLAGVHEAPVLAEEQAGVRIAPSMVHSGAASTVHTSSKDGKGRLAIYAVIAVIIAVAIGYWFGTREGVIVEADGDAINVDSLPAGNAADDAVGGSKEDGTRAPEGRDQLKETPAEQEPVEHVPEPAGTPREQPTPTRTDRRPPQDNNHGTTVPPSMTDSTATDTLERMKQREEY